jgi:hypothetical protein
MAIVQMIELPSFLTSFSAAINRFKLEQNLELTRLGLAGLGSSLEYWGSLMFLFTALPTLLSY